MALTGQAEQSRAGRKEWNKIKYQFLNSNLGRLLGINLAKEQGWTFAGSLLYSDWWQARMISARAEDVKPHNSLQVQARNHHLVKHLWQFKIVQLCSLLIHGPALFHFLSLLWLPVLVLFWTPQSQGWGCGSTPGIQPGGLPPPFFWKTKPLVKNKTYARSCSVQFFFHHWNSDAELGGRFAKERGWYFLFFSICLHLDYVKPLCSEGI